MFDSATIRIIKPPQIRHRPLPRPAGGSIRLDQSPVGMAFAIFLSIALAYEHAPIVTGKNPSATGKVFTTQRFQSRHDPTRPSAPITARKLPNSAENIFYFFQTAEVGLGPEMPRETHMGRHMGGICDPLTQIATHMCLGGHGEFLGRAGNHSVAGEAATPGPSMGVRQCRRVTKIT